MRTVRGFLWLAFALSFSIWAQSKSPTGIPARMIVTMGHYYTHEPPVLTTNDLTVTETYEPLTITSLTPLRGDRAGLEMLLLVDNCSTCEPGSKFTELQKFIGSQPSTTSVGVAYIQDGRLQIVENPTQDRERAVKALSPPAGSKPSDPFGALAELIKGWSPNSSRHVVQMISTGMDPGAAGAQALRSPSAEAAIEAAQRAGSRSTRSITPAPITPLRTSQTSIRGSSCSPTLRMRPAANPTFWDLDRCLRLLLSWPTSPSISRISISWSFSRPPAKHLADSRRWS